MSLFLDFTMLSLFLARFEALAPHLLDKTRRLKNTLHTERRHLIVAIEESRQVLVGGVVDAETGADEVTYGLGFELRYVETNITLDIGCRMTSGLASGRSCLLKLRSHLCAGATYLAPGICRCTSIAFKRA